MKTRIHHFTRLALATALILGTAAVAPADTWTVTSTEGYGTGTLREAIDLAQDGDMIVFDPSLDGQMIDLSTNVPLVDGYYRYEELSIDKDLTIQGPGSGDLTVTARSITRVFDVAYGATVTISGLSIVEGGGNDVYLDGFLGGGDWPDIYGGAVYNDGDLVLTDCVIADSQAAYGGGNFGGGIANRGTMSINSSTVTGNTVYGDSGYAGGGGIWNHGTMSIDSSSVLDNHRVDSEGNSVIDNIANYGTLKVHHSQIQKNGDSGTGGGKGHQK